jgi:hypothetical protein
VSAGRTALEKHQVDIPALEPQDYGGDTGQKDCQD